MLGAADDIFNTRIMLYATLLEANPTDDPIVMQLCRK